MKLKKYLQFLFLFAYFYQSYGQIVSSKMCETEIKNFNYISWHNMLTLDDGSTVILYSKSYAKYIYLMRYNNDCQLEVNDQLIFTNNYWRKYTEISKIFEIDNNLVFFISVVDGDDISLVRIIIDKKTSVKISESILFTYNDVSSRAIQWQNNFFDFTKNDSLRLYYLTTFINKTENTSILESYSFDYNHVQISKVNKKISINNYSSKYLSSIQNLDDYYLILNIKEVGKDELYQPYNQYTTIYKIKKDLIEELPIKIDNSEKPGSEINAQFTINNNHEVRLAVVNLFCSSGAEKTCDPDVSETQIYGLSNNKLEIQSSYKINQNALQHNHKDIKNIKKEDRNNFLNCLVHFQTSNENNDQLIFQSRKITYNANNITATFRDIGIFDIDKKGNIINAHSYPFNSIYTGNYKPLYISPQTCFTNYVYDALNYSLMLVVKSKNNDYILYNDYYVNLNNTKRDEAKQVKGLRNAIGVYISINKFSTIRMPLLKNNDDGYHSLYHSFTYNQNANKLSSLVIRNKKLYLVNSLFE